MSNIIDLNLLVQEPLILKGTDGETYTIPGGIPTELVLKMMAHDKAVREMKDDKEIFAKLIEMVADILNLDKSKNVDADYVRKHFDNMNVLMAITNIFTEHASKTQNDPNLPSPPSLAKK